VYDVITGDYGSYSLCVTMLTLFFIFAEPENSSGDKDQPNQLETGPSAPEEVNKKTAPSLSAASDGSDVFDDPSNGGAQVADNTTNGNEYSSFPCSNGEFLFWAKERVVRIAASLPLFFLEQLLLWYM